VSFTQATEFSLWKEVQLKVIPKLNMEFMIVHCSATPHHMDIGVKEIDEWHRSKGWFNGCGYHYVIRRDGTVETGPRLSDEGYHPGAHTKELGLNQRSIGICLVGGTVRKDKKKINGWDDSRPLNNFNKAQFVALKELLTKLQAEFPRRLRILGHRDVPNVLKDCPCFDVISFLGRDYPV
jgi:N-acetylmuramoyl-L-alanine amidase